jgi:NAD(P)-dependent dehydrogenase (short-subunit alcohol dehydrogenase family)
MSVEGKVVVITGGARGMGREIVRGFIKEGAMVVATDVSWVPSGYSNDTEDFYAEIKDNPNVLAATMDITIPAHVDWVYRQTIEKFGTVDVLICNGGTRQRDLYLDTHGSVTVLETEVADWERMFATHVFGNLRVIKRFIEPMIEKGRGSIITSASGQILNAHPAATADENARPGLRFGLSREGPYQPAKMALGAMCLYLAEELRGTNIAVNVLLPGHTATTGSDEQEAVRNAIRQRMSPTGATFIPRRVRADNVVPLALHLAEQDAEGITGRWIAAMDWNQENGFGGFETWGVAEDIAALQAAGRM